MKHISKLWILLAGISVLNTTQAAISPEVSPEISIVQAAQVGRAVAVMGLLMGSAVVKKFTDQSISPIIPAIVYETAPILGAVKLAIDQGAHPGLAAIGGVAGWLTYRASTLLLGVWVSCQDARNVLLGMSLLPAVLAWEFCAGPAIIGLGAQMAVDTASKA